VYALIALAAVLIGWALISARAARWSVTTPMALLAAGALVAGGDHALVDIDINASSLRTLLELTLAVVLFSDATELSPRALHRAGSLPLRLLAIGFPLTVAAGYLAGLLLFPNADVWILALLAAALAATDAGLTAAVVHDTRVPSDLRTAVNVESGLNDGLATPLVLFFLAAAVASEAGHGTGGALAHTLRELVVAVVVGGVLGAGCGWLLRRSRQLRWSRAKATRIAYLALALLSFEATHLVHGNGFVAAFVAGLAVRAVDARLPERDMVLAQDVVSVLSAVVWFIFGSLLPVVFREMTWQIVAYAVVSLTVVRMLPVAASLIGLGRNRRDVLFLGWLGPRGLASIIFALIALEQLTGDSAILVAGVITTTVVFSVLAHGLTAGPIAAHYRVDHELEVPVDGVSTPETS